MPLWENKTLTTFLDEADAEQRSVASLAHETIGSFIPRWSQF